MRLKQLIKILTKISEDNKGNPEVLFDTEAALFPCHMVDILRATYISKDMSPDNKAIVSLMYDFNITPCLHLTEAQRKEMIKVMVKREDKDK